MSPLSRTFYTALSDWSPWITSKSCTSNTHIILGSGLPLAKMLQKKKKKAMIERKRTCLSICLLGSAAHLQGESRGTWGPRRVCACNTSHSRCWPVLLGPRTPCFVLPIECHKVFGMCMSVQGIQPLISITNHLHRSPAWPPSESTGVGNLDMESRTRE